jgi:D-alanyl-D-alanine carboxypeptidase (penicillin-binding protein 5/6)
MQKAEKSIKVSSVLLLIVLILGLFAWWLPYQPVAPSYYPLPPPLASSAGDIRWPGYGQAALGAKDYGLLETYGAQQAVPMASVAKAFTALAVLKQKPLKPGQDGPVITLTQTDLDSYESYFSRGGSLVPVALGEQITQRQALQALMLPSANNMADTLARWAFGSTDKYVSYANSFAGSVGLKNTRIADASGFSSETVSSAEDLVKLGRLVLANPTLSEIVAQDQAVIPVAGTIRSTNWLLGTEGINGIKTGNTDEAGGCYLFSAQRTIGGKPVQVIGAIMGAPSLIEAIRSARVLLVSADSGFVNSKVAAKNQKVGEYVLPWGKKVPFAVAEDVSITTWYKKKPVLNLSAVDVKKTSRGQSVGMLNSNGGVDKKTAALVAAADSGDAPWTWRLFKRYL